MPVILITSANGKTARHIMPLLLEAGSSVRALSHRMPAAPIEGVEWITGDINDPNTIARCMDGVAAVIHIGPTFHPREVPIGTAMVDAARSAGIAKFVYFSVIHPQIDDLLNHQNKLHVEAHLVHSRMDWTILQPQHYMQNIDVRRVLGERCCALPYSPDRTLGFVDLADVAEVAVKVTTQPGHRWATYELAADDHLSTKDIARIVAQVSGVPDIAAAVMDVEAFLPMFGQSMSAGAYDDRSAHGLRRLFSYYDHYGISGNANVLSWLLGRRPNTFADYCKRELARSGR